MLLLHGGQLAAQGTGAPSNNPQIVRSAGAYTAATNGSKHSWEVTNFHTLIWDGTPYIPVGGDFTPRSFTADDPSLWKADTDALNTLKAHGIQDLIIWPNVSIVAVPASRFQRLIDYLDANGFRYGLSFGPGITTPQNPGVTAPLTGIVVRPVVYRFEDSSKITAIWQAADTDIAAYFLVDANRDSAMVRAGMATVRDHVATAPLDAPTNVSRPVALLLPQKSLPATSDAAMPDLWQQFDSYRDQVLAYLTPIKFGPGLRFFLDPLARHLGLSEEASYLIPESNGYRLEWESYLKRKYSDADEIRDKWKLIDEKANTELTSFEALARLLPLWSRDRGFPYLYDPTNGNYYRVDLNENIQSTWWDDFSAFRSGSLNFYLNAMAAVLKRRVADVPVVYTLSQSDASFADPDPSGGFDGYAVATQFQDSHRLARVTGPAYSQAEQAGRTLWLITSQLTDSAPATGKSDGPTTAFAGPPASDKNSSVLAVDNGSASGASGTSIENRKSKIENPQSLQADLLDLRRIGFKGFFIDSLQPASGTSIENRKSEIENLSDDLHTCITDLSNDPLAARRQPQVLYYPQSAPGPAHIGIVPGSSEVYWLPARMPGRVIDWWPSLSGYSFSTGENSEVTVLMSLLGPRKIHLFVPNAAKIAAITPEGAAVPFKQIGKTGIEITFGREPILFNAAGQDLVPEQATTDAMEQLAYLTQMARSLKTQTADYARIQLDESSVFYSKKNYPAAYSAARQQIETLLADVQPYSWMEGENSIIKNFTEYAPNPEASSGGYLRLSTPNPPSKLSYAARYVFSSPADDDYDVWLAGTPPGPNTSPITWYMDQQPEQEPANPHPQGPLYLSDYFGWFLLGRARLDKGLHNLTIKVVDRAPATHLYSFSIDAIMVTPRTRPFVPNATIRPIPVDPDLASGAFKSMLKDIQKDIHPTKKKRG